LLALFLASAPSIGDEAREPASESLDALASGALDAALEQEMRRQNVVGLAIGIIRDGQVAYAQGYGFEDREAKVPVTRQTMFRWASISKPLTALAAMQLVERGQLDLDADVRKYVPEFTDKGVRITARQLLCHQSGIVHYKNGPVVRTERQYDVLHPYQDVVLALDTFKDSPLIDSPGKAFSYTTHGFILLSAVVQRAGKQPFAEQVAQRIAQPLGMTSLQPDYQWKDIAHRAVGYRPFGTFVLRSTDTDVSWKLGGGGFISTIDDLARLAAGLIERKLVSESTETMMWTPQSTSDGEKTNVGLGFFVESQEGLLKISHSGSQEKTKTRLVIYPRQRHGVVIISNSENADPKRFTTVAYQALKK